MYHLSFVWQRYENVKMQYLPFTSSWKNCSISNLVVYLFLSIQCMGIWLVKFFNIHYVLLVISEFYHFCGCTSCTHLHVLSI